MYKSIPLPYGYSELEPYIDRETMNIHFNTHYMTYIKNLNDEMKKNNHRSIPIRDLIKTIDDYSDNVRNNAGGFFNHFIFWQMLSPNKTNGSNLPSGISKTLINRDFGSYDNFKKLIEAKAKKRFGSGWVWWIMMPSGSTRIVETPYQDNPLMYFNCEVLLGIDVWEHAYYLKYHADRMAYVKNIFNVINWKYPNEILNKYYR
jgi:Fe-Mn family superoxide dismutase